MTLEELLAELDALPPSAKSATVFVTHGGTMTEHGAIVMTEHGAIVIDCGVLSVRYEHGEVTICCDTGEAELDALPPEELI